MASEPLATLPDLEGRLGQDIDDTVRAELLLIDVSEMVKGYTGRTFSPVDDDTVTLYATNSTVTLPNGPVTAVTAVKVDDVDVWFRWTSGRKVRVRSHCVDVTYSWGPAEVPGDIVAVVCQIAGRAYGVKPTESSVTGENLGSYGFTRGAAGGAGPLGMLDDERAVLDRYRSSMVGTITTPTWADLRP